MTTKSLVTWDEANPRTMSRRHEQQTAQILNNLILSGQLTNTGKASALVVPLASVTGLGTGVATALAINVGSSGAVAVNGSLGTATRSVANGTSASISNGTDLGTAFGFGATVTANYGTAVGGLATSASGGVAFGQGATAAVNAFALGVNTVAGGGSVAAGNTAMSTGLFSIAIGYQATSGGFDTTIVLGVQAAATATHQFVAGSDFGYVDNVYFGSGVVSTAPAGYIINGTGGSGSNVAGGSLTYAGGKGTGTATPGILSFKVSIPTTSGSTVQSLREGARVDGNTTAGETMLLLWDVNAAALVRVSVGANDSGGAGFKVLRVPN